MLGGPVTRVRRPHKKKAPGGFTPAHASAPTIPQPDRSRDPDAPSEGSCGVCSGGLVSILVRIPDDQRAPCYKPNAARSHAYRCLCAFGQRKPRHVFGPDVGEVLGSDAVREMFPDGVPAVTASGGDPRAAMERAGVPPAMATWTFSTYQANGRLNSPANKRFLKYATGWIGDTVDVRSDVVLFGPNGTGKSGLAVAMLRAALEGHEAVHFTTLKLLSTQWRGTYGRKTEEGRSTSPEEDLLNRLLRLDVLVIDEIGGTRLSDFIEDTLTMIVDMRQKGLKPTILTVNVAADDTDPSQAMAAILGPALFDRLRERAQFWPLTGKSARPILSLTRPTERTTTNGDTD